MSPKRRLTGPRFHVGDTVRITSTILTRFAGMSGLIIEVRESRHSCTLDKYVLRVDKEPEDRVFWDIQLKAA
jgi:transcription antitermination factor NusG